MIHAYDKVLLDRAANTLGRMLDYSVYSLHYDAASCHTKFSKKAVLCLKGHSRVIQRV